MAKATLKTTTETKPTAKKTAAKKTKAPQKSKTESLVEIFKLGTEAEAIFKLLRREPTSEATFNDLVELTDFSFEETETGIQQLIEKELITREENLIRLTTSVQYDAAEAPLPGKNVAQEFIKNVNAAANEEISSEKVLPAKPQDLSESEGLVFEALIESEKDFDTLCDFTDLPVVEVSAALKKFENRGLLNMPAEANGEYSLKTLAEAQSDANLPDSPNGNAEENVESFDMLAEQPGNGGNGLKTRKPKNYVPEQPDLPGTEGEKDEEIHSAVLEYESFKQERIMVGNQEKKAKEWLLALMKKKAVTLYSYRGVEAEITHEKENVKTRVNNPKDSD